MVSRLRFFDLSYHFVQHLLDLFFRGCSSEVVLLQQFGDDLLEGEVAGMTVVLLALRLHTTGRVELFWLR
jgi:hypothetical protein